MKIVSGSITDSTLTITINTARLDAATASAFKSDCEALWQSSVTNVVADLSSVEFIDSSGVGALLNLYRRLPPANPSVKLRNTKPTVQAVIELLRLHRIFELEG